MTSTGSVTSLITPRPIARAQDESRRVAVEVLEPIARIPQTDAVGDLTVDEPCAVVGDGENQ